MQSSIIYCKHCRAANQPTARFCSSCGQPLAVASPPSQPPPFQAPQAPPLPPNYWKNLRAEIAARPRPPRVPKRSVLCTYRGHHSKVCGLAWSADGTRIASSSEDGTVQVWQATNGSHIFTFHDHFSVVALAWSPDGTHIASAGENGVKLWDAVKMGDAADGGHIYSYHGEGYYNGVYALAWSPDGTRLAAGNRGDKMIAWNATSRKTLFTCKGYGGDMSSLAWSPDGHRIAVGDNIDKVLVRDAASGAGLHLYQGHSKPIHALAWSPDSTCLASASSDTTVQVWRVP